MKQLCKPFFKSLLEKIDVISNDDIHLMLDDFRYIINHIEGDNIDNK